MPYYFDHSATTPLLPEARAAMIEAMDLSVAGELGNASSLHSRGRRAHEIIEDARKAVAHLIGARPDEIIFTSGGSESNNTAMHIFEDCTIYTSPMEHPSVLESAKEYGKTDSVDFETEAPAKCRQGDAEGSFEGPKTWPSGPERPEKEPSRRPCLYSCMLANNETGALLDLPHVSGTYLHTDATQALGKIPIDVKSLGVDYLTASAHKIGGPAGIGLLYVKHGAPYKPLILGGHQEHGRRAGTSQVIHIAGFGAAAKYTADHQTWDLYEQRIRPLRDLLAHRILTEIPYSSLNTNLDKSLPHILNTSFRAAEGESIQLYLDLEGNIAVSTGSACASGDGRPSHVLMALTGDAEVAHSSVRFSLGLDTTKSDIDHIMTHLTPIIKKLQGISTIKTGRVASPEGSK